MMSLGQQWTNPNSEASSTSPWCSFPWSAFPTASSATKKLDNFLITISGKLSKKISGSVYPFGRFLQSGPTQPSSSKNWSSLKSRVFSQLSYKFWLSPQCLSLQPTFALQETGAPPTFLGQFCKLVSIGSKCIPTLWPIETIDFSRNKPRKKMKLPWPTILETLRSKISHSLCSRPGWSTSHIPGDKVEWELLIFWGNLWQAW